MSHDATKATSAVTSTKSNNNENLVVIIAGPTGVGKSDVAARICASERGFVVSADSVQAYTQVQIGANKPSERETQETPHLLIDVSDFTESYNAAEWRADAIYCIERLLQKTALCDDEPDYVNPERRKTIDEYISESKISKGYEKDETILPVICGGTMMYLQWLVHGKPDAQRPSRGVVQKAKSKIAEYQANDDWEGAVQYVSSLGEIFANRTTQFCGLDWYRLERTLEVAYTYLDSDRKDALMENLYSGQRQGRLDDMGYDVRCIFLCPDDRMSHTAVVDQRCEQMIVQGLVKETSDLVLAGCLPDMASRAIGYRQTLDYLSRDNPSEARKEEEFDTFLDSFTTATRRYAKKQMSWFRKDGNFLFVPVSVSDDKEIRVQKVTTRVRQLIRMPRSEYDQELMDSESESTLTKDTNEKQGKAMKFYQPSRYILMPNSDAYRAAVSEGMECTNRLQSKRVRKVEAEQRA